MNLPSQELERAAANVIEKAGMNVVDGATGFGSNLFNGLLGDRVREWRNRNFLLGAAETAEVLAERGIPLEATKALPMFEIYSIFQGMAEQDDPDVRKLWAGLLASRMNPSEKSGFDRSVSQILSTMNGSEARILNYMAEFWPTFAEINASRPRPFYRSSDKTKTENEEEKKKNEWFDNFLINRLEILKNRFLDPSTEEEIHAATRSLVLKRLIAKKYSFVQRHNLLHRNSISFDAGSVETLDHEGVVNAFEELNGIATGQAGIAEDTTPLISWYERLPVLNFSLTDLGEYLLSKCLAPQEK